jgi:hypothetical protein
MSPRTLLLRLLAIPAVGQDYDLVRADEEPARVACDLLLALGEHEPGQVARVLAADAEVAINALPRQTLA